MGRIKEPEKKDVVSCDENSEVYGESKGFTIIRFIKNRSVYNSEAKHRSQNGVLQAIIYLGH